MPSTLEPSLSLTALLPLLSSDGRDFERLTKWFLENDPQERSEFRRVWLWDEWPGRWGRDRGIDLVAERHDGELIAVQAKNYGEAHSITKHDVDKFLSESNRVEISGRLLIGTTDKIARSAMEVMDAQEKPVRTLRLADLLASAVSWPRAIGELRPTPEAETVEPRPHQLEALEAIEKWAETNEPRAKVIMACGTGKSLLCIWAAERLVARSVLVLVPTNALLRQTATEWVTHSKTKRQLLRVCGDNAPDEEAWDRGDELGVERTTDAGLVAEQLGKGEPLLVICTYKSSPVIAEAMKLAPGASFDLAVADEAHHCAGVAKRAHKTIVREGEINARRRLFVTATPTIFAPDAKARAADRNVQIASMDDRTLFGREIYRLSFGQAIERELLCPYQVAVIPIKDEEIRKMVEGRTLVTPDGDAVLDAATLATQVACARAMARFRCRRMVAFHSSVDHSKRFTALFPLAMELLAEDERPPGRLWAEHVDGAGMAFARRAKIIRQFKDEDSGTFRLLSNVRLLAEGVDVAGIDAVTFVATDRGPTSIIQAVGRAVRRAEGKSVGTIVLPIVMREGESFDAALGRSEHKTIVEVLGALRSHDPEIARSLDDLRFDGDARRYTVPAGAGRFVIDAPVEVDREFAEAIDIALTNKLGVETKRKAQRDDGPRVMEMRYQQQPEPNPDDELTYLFSRLVRMTWSGPLPNVPSDELESGFAWLWQVITARWGELDIGSKEAVADSVSWLAPQLSKHPEQRREMSVLTRFTLPELALGQLRASEDLMTEFESLIYVAYHDRTEDALKAIHAAVTHPGMPPDKQLQLLHEALCGVSVALNAAEELERNAYWSETSPYLLTALDGFVHELEAARVGEPDRRSAPKLPSTRSRTAQKLGQAAAEPFLDRVRELRPYRFSGAEKAVEDRRHLEARMEDPDERFDELGWELFLLILAKGGRENIEQLAMEPTLDVRLRLRADFLERINREFAFVASI